MIDLLNLPFNQLVGIQLSDKENYLLMLPDDSKYHNHLNAIHAAALFMLAESTAGQFLLNTFKDVEGAIPLVRKSNIKFRTPATGAIYGNADFVNCSAQDILNELIHKGRTTFLVKTILYDMRAQVVFTGEFEWFVSFSNRKFNNSEI